MSDTRPAYATREWFYGVQRPGAEFNISIPDSAPREGPVGIYHVFYDDERTREEDIHHARIFMATGDRPETGVPWLDYDTLPEAMRTRLIRSKIGKLGLIREADSSIDDIGHHFAEILTDALNGKIAIAPVQENVAATSRFFYIWEPSKTPPAFCFLHQRAGAIEFASIRPPRTTTVARGYNPEFPELIEGAILPRLTRDVLGPFVKVDPFVYVSSPYRSYIAERPAGFKATITAMVVRTADEIFDRRIVRAGLRPNANEAAEIKARLNRLSGAVIRYVVHALNDQHLLQPSAKGGSAGRFSFTEYRAEGDVNVYYEDPRLDRVQLVNFKHPVLDGFRALPRVLEDVVLSALAAAEPEIAAAPRRASRRKVAKPSGSSEELKPEA